MSLRLISIVLLLVVSLSRLDAQYQSQNRSHPLYLLVLLPYPHPDGDPSWSGALNVLPAIKMAEKHIQSSELLPGYNLTVLDRDCGCNYTNRARISFMENLMYSEQQIVGIIGPGCSASTVALAPLTVQDSISLIHIHGAGTPKLENHTRYHNSFGIFGSAHGIVSTMITLIKSIGWSTVGVLYDSARVFQSSTHDAFIQRTSNFSAWDIRIHSAAVTDHYYHLDQIQERSLRIVFLLAGPALARNLLCLAYSRNMTYPRIQWVIVERLLTEFDEDVDVYYEDVRYICSRDTMTKYALNGSVFITYKLANLNTSDPTKSGQSYDEFLTEYSREIEAINNDNGVNQTVKISPWGSMYYDSMWAIAIALDQLQKSFDLQEYGKNNSEATLYLRQEMYKLNFTGVSGLVRFNNETGFNERGFDISQATNGNMTSITYCDGEACIKDVSQYIPEVFLNDSFSTRIQMRSMTLNAIIVLTVITICIFCITFVLHILAIHYRNDYFVRAASIKLSQTSYAGCYFLLSTCFVCIVKEAIVDEVTKSALCHFSYVLCSIGITLLFGTILAKTWRLYRISNHYLKPGRLLTDKMLLILVLLATVGDIFINILWILIDPFEIESHQFGFDGTTLEVLVTSDCHANYIVCWYLALYVYNFLFAIAACALAMRTRKIYILGFQTKVVVKMTYATFFVMGLGIPIQVIMLLDHNLEPTVMFVFNIAILNIFVLLSNWFLFIPPLWPKVNNLYKECISNEKKNTLTYTATNPLATIKTTTTHLQRYL